MPGPSRGQPGHLLPYRPLTVADTLDGAFRLMRRTFGRAALVVLAIMGPYQLLSNLVLFLLLPELADPRVVMQAEELVLDPVELLVRLGGWTVVFQVVGLLVNVVVAAAVVALVLQADLDEPLDAVAALRTSLARSGATVGASVLTLGLVVVSLVVLVPLAVVLVFVPVLGILAVFGALVLGLGVYAGVYSLVVPIAIVEEGGPWRTFVRALWVLRVRFLRVVGITLLVMLVLGFVGGAVTLPLAVLSFVVGPFSWVVDGLAGTLVAVVTAPVTAYAALLVHLDARVRAEGLDLELRARHLRG